MMITYLRLLIFALPITCFAASPVENFFADTHMQAIDSLILASDFQNDNDLKIKEQITVYEEAKKKFRQFPHDARNGTELVKAANTLQKMIEAQHLKDMFDNAFIHEITLFSTLSQKKGLSRPSL